MAAPEDRALRRRHERDRVLRRRRRVALIVLGAFVSLVALLAIGSSSRKAARSAAQSHRQPSTEQQDARPPVARAEPRVLSPAPGSLPQTHAYPPGSGARFSSLMAALWSGVVGDSPGPALAAFFPREAYTQVKAIYSAGSDWTNRLVHDYELDIAAAHGLLGADPARARLVRVLIPSGYGHWVPPGACYNRVGYYELPNARVVYSQNGQIRSFGIASMISWRGVWYVVHLGAILRSSDSGTVDEPELGQGTPVYSGTC